MALPLAGIAALAIGVAVVEAAVPAPSSGSTNYAQVFINKLAAILHLTPTQTQNDLKQAQLQTIDQMVKDGQITQAQADALKNRLNAGAGIGYGFPFRKFGHFGDRSLSQSLRTAEFNAVAGALKMTPADLQTQLRSGKSLSDLEQAKGVSDSTVRSAESAAAKKVLDAAVKAGTITQSQEDAILSRLGQAVPFRGFGGRPFLGDYPQQPLPIL